jgi:hypothetical protein
MFDVAGGAPARMAAETIPPFKEIVGSKVVARETAQRLGRRSHTLRIYRHRGPQPAIVKASKPTLIFRHHTLPR